MYLNSCKIWGDLVHLVSQNHAIEEENDPIWVDA